jgi:hypothetical protein
MLIDPFANVLTQIFTTTLVSQLPNLLGNDLVVRGAFELFEGFNDIP